MQLIKFTSRKISKFSLPNRLKLSLVATYFGTLFVKMDALSDIFGSN